MSLSLDAYMCMSTFLDFLSCCIDLYFFLFFVCVCVCVPVTYCLDCWSFVVYSEARKVDSSSPILLSQHFFDYSGSFFRSVVQLSCSVLSDFLWPHVLQHTRPPCPSWNPRVYSNSCPLSRWCHPTISSSVIPFSSHLEPFPALGSFQMSQHFATGS